MMPPPRETQTSPRPESVRLSASKKQTSALNLNTSQTNLVVDQQHPSSSALNLVSPVHRSTSRTSLREEGLFSDKFDDGTYLDPAFYPGEGPIAGNGHRGVAGQQQQKPEQLSSSVLNLVSPIRPSTSQASLRRAGSFGDKFDDGTYLDPAFYPGDRPTAGDGHRNQASLNAPSRPVSRGTSSVLSYY
jgi:hypothetical protein